MVKAPDRKGDVGTALACFMTAAALAPWSIAYLMLTRAPKSKPAPERRS
jgi:hypothetical protein